MTFKPTSDFDISNPQNWLLRKKVNGLISFYTHFTPWNGTGYCSRQETQSWQKLLLFQEVGTSIHICAVFIWQTLIVHTDCMYFFLKMSSRVDTSFTLTVGSLFFRNNFWPETVIMSQIHLYDALDDLVHGHKVNWVLLSSVFVEGHLISSRRFYEVDHLGSIWEECLQFALQIQYFLGTSAILPKVLWGDGRYVE